MQGSIEVRKGSRGVSYRARVSVVRNGERVWVSRTFSRKREAAAWLAEHVNDEHHGGLVLPDPTTVGELMARWLLAEVRPTVRDSTLEDYEGTVRLHVLPTWGNTRLVDVSAAGVQRWLEQGLADRSPRVKAAAHDRLRQAFDAAVRWGLVKSNPVRSVRRPRVEYEIQDPWTADEVRAFLTATDGSAWHHLWLVALGTGMRLGELLGLTWDNVNLEAGTISVGQQVQVVRNRLVVAPLKTKAARRTVRIDDTVIAALGQRRKEWVAERLRRGDEWGDWVWTCDTGGPTRPTSVHRAWKQALKTSKARGIRFHDLRHTHATLLLAAGVSIPVVAQRLGHANAAITMGTYAHALPDGQERAAQEIGLVLHRA